ncbi:uncharacterized protein V1510DRAFT_404245 [Dipodascopsis tothii]|uniref:uncharacterized protein n=1 Tax=Dipodascopsis tothii TaxID=44089 RepID=UPI0034CF00F8
MVSVDQLENVARWAEAHGGFRARELEFYVDNETGSGARATAPLGEGARLLECPRALVLDAGAAVARLYSDPGRAPPERTPTVHVRLLVCLEALAGDDSLWAPYMAALPRRFTTPLFFTPADEPYLAGTNLAGEAAAREREWRAEWAAVAAEPPDRLPAACSWDLYLWACTVLTSRAFPSTLFGEPESYPVLVPLVDALNHRPREAVEWAVGPAGMALVAAAARPCGAELFNNYGPKGNEELLMGYGFCLPDNEFDTVALRLHGHGVFHLSRADPLPAALVEIFADPAAPLAPALAGLERLYDSLYARGAAHGTALPPPPTACARAALLYRQGQRRVLEAALEALVRRQLALAGSAPGRLAAVADMRAALRTSLCARAVTVERALADPAFAAALGAVYGMVAAEQVVDGGAEDQVLLLFLCRLYLSGDAAVRKTFAAAAAAADERADAAELAPIVDAVVPAMLDHDPALFGPAPADLTADLIAAAADVLAECAIEMFSDLGVQTIVVLDE